MLTPQLMHLVVPTYLQGIYFIWLTQMVNVDIFRPNRLLSASNAGELVAWTKQALETGVDILLIDFCQVMFMDSSGLGTLVSALKLVQKAEGRLALCSLGGQALMLFEMAGMEKLFETYSNLDEFESALSGT
jgi:anti-sigma B factor antagonist